MAPRNRGLRAKAYGTLRARIMDLRYAPGAKVDETALATELEVSRMPVREALHQLAAEGLIEIEERGGYRVTTIDISVCRELFEAQLMVARATTLLLVGNVTPHGISWLEAANARVEQAIADGDPGRIAQMNSELHILESELAGNSYLHAMAERVYVHEQRLAYMSFTGAGGLGSNLDEHHRRVCIDHRDYLYAIADHDRDTALLVANRHVDLFRNRVMQYLKDDTLATLDF